MYFYPNGDKAKTQKVNCQLVGVRTIAVQDGPTISIYNEPIDDKDPKRKIENLDAKLFDSPAIDIAFPDGVRLIFRTGERNGRNSEDGSVQFFTIVLANGQEYSGDYQA